ncbi:MAG: Lysozyme [candidate division TM6 bacterium GW2011_GWE2_42_60]|nr:MAG: Lysozyme [candidate division TM6 bacterium GW2011_GWE2_42_60]
MEGVLFIRRVVGMFFACLAGGCGLMGAVSPQKSERVKAGSLLTQAERLDFVRLMKKEPAILAFLDAIGFAEGSFKNRPYEHSLKGYLLRYPGVSFYGFKDHPQTVICSSSLGRQICSSAAGRYMFLSKTWERVAKSLGLKDFSPVNQDLGAIYLVWQHDALDDILQGRFERAIYKVRDVWASFPGSSYGQPQKRMRELKKLFNERLQYYTNGGRL